MTSMAKILTPSLKTTNRRRGMTTTRRSRRRPYVNPRRAHRKSFNKGGRNNQYCSKVSDKLQALKNLIPAQNDNREIKAEVLYQETADYIVLLRTQVVILQRLIQFHGSCEDDENALL